MPKIKNRTPVIDAVAPLVVLESAIAGFVVVRVHATDPDGDTLIYSITAGNEAGIFAVDASGNISIAQGKSLDYATTTSYDLTVKVDDGRGGLATTVLHINVDENDAPAGITLSTDAVAAGVAGATVGSLLTLDPDQGDSHTYAIIGDSPFEVVGSDLKLKDGVSIVSGQSATVTVTTTDVGGLSKDVTFTITAASPPLVVDLGALAPDQGFTIAGEPGSGLGWPVSAAGDVNGDGIDDFMMTAGNVGDVYVLFGEGETGAFAEIDLADDATWDGIRISGSISVGFAIAAAGDVNGDGYDDVLLGDPFRDLRGIDSGQCFLVYGEAGSRSINLDNLAAADATRILGAAGGAFTGYSVSAGDLNGDGFGDLVISGSLGTTIGSGRKSASSGEIYVIYGGDQQHPLGHTVDLANSATWANGGAHLTGPSFRDEFANSLAVAGDMNGDGRADLIVGAVGTDADGNSRTVEGAAYVIFGPEGGFKGEIDLADPTKWDGFRILGADHDDRTGQFVAAAGDVNGDGLADVLVSAGGADGAGLNVGEVSLIFGKPGEGRGDVDLDALTAADGIRFVGLDDYDTAGVSIASAGDVNNDAYDDFLISTRGDGESNAEEDAGETWLIFGRADWSGVDTIVLNDLDPQIGFVIRGADAGDNATHASAAGDINQDGYDDILVGAWGVDAGTIDSGAAYVIFGHDYFGA